MPVPSPSHASTDAALSIQRAASETPGRVLDLLGSTRSGLSQGEAEARLLAVGPNAVRSHHAGAWSVLARQLASPLLWLLIGAAIVSALVGERVDATIIGAILLASVGLGFVNEYRAARAAEALHSEIRHVVTVVRDGKPNRVEVTHLVMNSSPGRPTGTSPSSAGS